MNALSAKVAAGTSIVRIRDLVKDYRRGAETVRVLDGLSLDIQQGEITLDGSPLADEALAAYQQVNVRARFSPISICAGVFEVQPA